MMMYGLSPFGRNGYDLFNNFFGDTDRDFTGNSMPMSTFKTDIRDDGEKYVMESELPGFEKEDISLDINGAYLTISAEHKASEEKKDGSNYIRRERKFSSYKRSFDITDVDTNGISAEYKNGILIIDLPKKKPEEPVSKRLEIK